VTTPVPTKYRLTFTLGNVSAASGAPPSSSARLNALSGELWEAGYVDCRAWSLEPTAVVVVTREAESLGAAVGEALEVINRAGYRVVRVDAGWSDPGTANSPGDGRNESEGRTMSTTLADTAPDGPLERLARDLLPEGEPQTPAAVASMLERLRRNPAAARYAAARVAFIDMASESGEWDDGDAERYAAFGRAQDEFDAAKAEFERHGGAGVGR